MDGRIGSHSNFSETSNLPNVLSEGKREGERKKEKVKWKKKKKSRKHFYVSKGNIIYWIPFVDFQHYRGRVCLHVGEWGLSAWLSQ
jgi:hypothetical protein